MYRKKSHYELMNFNCFIFNLFCKNKKNFCYEELSKAWMEEKRYILRHD